MPIISLLEAQKLNYSLEIPNLGIVKKNIYQSVGEILACDRVCQKPLPAFDNSAMDGYAFKACDREIFEITACILAGENASHIQVPKGSCVRIMTGAMLPQNVDVVVPFEEVQKIDECHIKVPHLVKTGSNIRKKGEEKSLGEIIAKKGDKLTPALIALMASQGILEIEVYERLKIGVYSSGNEIIEPGQNAQSYQIYNANAAGIVSLLSAYGHQVSYLGIIKDSLESHLEAITNFENYDVIITSGGVSVGDADLLEKSLIKKNANIIYQGINVKPGKPLMLATLKKCIIFALPGNPLSGMLNLNAMIIPALERLRGANAFYPQVIFADLKESIQLKSARVNMILGKYHNGNFEAYNGGKYGSAAINVMSECNAIALSDETLETLKGRIKILPYLMEFSDTIVPFIND